MPLSIDISEAEIRNAIAVALAESFTGEKRDALLRDVVRAHLQHREGQYDKETILSKVVGKQVREMAGEELDRILDSMRDDVHRIVGEELGEQFQISVYNTLRTSLRRVVLVNLVVSAQVDES